MGAEAITPAMILSVPVEETHGVGAPGGFYQEWIEGTTEIDGAKIEFALTSGAGCGNAYLALRVSVDGGDSTWFRADMPDLVRQWVPLAVEAMR